MTIRNYLCYENGGYKRRPSNVDSTEFLSVKIGASALEIKETAGAFDVTAKKIVNLAPGSVSGEAVEYGQLAALLAAKLDTSVSGVSNGLATLDGGGKIPATQLPNSVMELQGFWNAASNSPVLADGAGNAGDVYLVSVSGVRDLGSGEQTFNVNDFAIYAGSVWKHSPASNAVMSVNGKSGVVTLTTSDIAEGSNKYYVVSTARSDLIAASISSGDTTHAPDGASVYTALGGKSDTGHNHSGVYAPVVHTHTASSITDFSDAAKAATVSQVITDGVTGYAPSENTVFDALALKADLTVVNAPAVSLTNKQGGGTSITIRQVVFQSAEGQVQKAIASGSYGIGTFFGMVKDASIADNALGSIFVPEKGTQVSGFSGLDVALPVYLSRTVAGGYQQDLTGFVAGDKVVSLGKVLTPAILIFDPKFLLEY